MEFKLTGYAFEQLEAKLAPLQKRAAKLGLPLVVVEVLATEMVEANDQDGFPRLYPMHTVRVEGAEPKVGDFTFAATLDHREGAGVVLRKAPTFKEELPERFRTTDKHCDHCQKVRNRAEVFVLQNQADGAFVQVGRQCIKDFLGGVDPAGFAAILEEWEQFFKWLEEGGGGDGFGGGFSGRGTPHVKAQDVLVRAAQAIRMYGWTPRSQEGGYPTAGRVTTKLFGKDEPATTNFGKSPVYYDEKYTGGEMVRATISGLGNLEPTDADRLVADGTLAFVAGLPGKTDFEHNLKVLCGPDLEYVKAKDVGMVAAAVMVYARHLGALAEREVRAKLQTGDAWVGEVGKRMTAELTFVEKKTFEGNQWQEVRTLVKMVDAAGNDVTWWTGYTDHKGHFLADVARGQKLGLCAFTPKKHGEYNGRKQTVVARLAPAPAKAAKKGQAA